MKSAIIFAIFALFLLNSADGRAEISVPDTDTTIRVLLVADNASVDPSLLAQQVLWLTDAWTYSNMDSIATIQIVNPAGIPYEFDLGFPCFDMGCTLPLTAQSIRTEVETFVELPLNPNIQGALSLRQLYAADVVIAFTSASLPNSCGFGYQPNWAGINRKRSVNCTLGIDFVRGNELRCRPGRTRRRRLT